LKVLDMPKVGHGSFEDCLNAVVKDASMHFTLPRTSLTSMLTDGLLTPQQIAYEYAAWQFTFHFMHRLPESFSIVSKSLQDRDPSASAHLEQLRSTIKLNTYTHVHGVADPGPHPELGRDRQDPVRRVPHAARADGGRRAAARGGHERDAVDAAQVHRGGVGAADLVRFLDVMRGSIPMIYPSRAQVYQDNAAAWSTCNPSEKS